MIAPQPVGQLGREWVSSKITTALMAAVVVTSTAHTLSRVMESKGLRREAMHACNHLLTLHEIPQHVPAAAQLAMARYIKNPREIAH